MQQSSFPAQCDCTRCLIILQTGTFLQQARAAEGESRASNTGGIYMSVHVFFVHDEFPEVQ